MNTTNESPTYRFDDAYQRVYRLTDEGDAYIHHGSYLQYGIQPNWSDAAKQSAVENTDDLQEALS